VIAAAILAPVFLQQKDSPRQPTCLSNTKQLGTAIVMYLQDWDEQMPPAVQTAAVQVADLCPDRKGPVVLGTIYDDLFPYMNSARILQCPNDPKAVDLCSDLGKLAPELAGEPLLGSGSVKSIGYFRYLSYAFNRTLFGLGGFKVAGADLTRAVHKRLGNRIGFPYGLDQIPYPADTPLLFDGYVIGQRPNMIVEARHIQTANVAYVDGHSKAFHLTELRDGDYLTDTASGRAMNRFCIDHGPYRSDPGAQPNSSFDGIVTDPVCAATTVPSRDCVSRSAPAPKPSRARGAPGKGSR
jgi:prepilin-type processing-associated H-X9-DG protein